MGDWSEIETNFNTADETINFGSRKYSGLDNLYETSTLAVIKNSGVNKCNLKCMLILIKLILERRH